MSARNPVAHQIELRLASDAQLTLHLFSETEHRWIFSYRYVGEENREVALSPIRVINEVRLVADFGASGLEPTIVLSMHVIIPSRFGQKYLYGLDISPGAKTYLEFTYARQADEYRLVEICKGANYRLRLDALPPDALIKPVEFPFPIPDRVPVEHGGVRFPFLSNTDNIDYFDLPMNTRRWPGED